MSRGVGSKQPPLGVLHTCTKQLFSSMWRCGSENMVSAASPCLQVVTAAVHINDTSAGHF